MSETRPFEYGGGHVIEDLIKGKEVELRAIAYGTACYPRTKLETVITKDDLNQLILLNFHTVINVMYVQPTVAMKSYTHIWVNFFHALEMPHSQERRTKSPYERSGL